MSQVSANHYEGDGMCLAVKKGTPFGYGAPMLAGDIIWGPSRAGVNMLLALLLRAVLEYECHLSYSSDPVSWAAP